MNRRVGYGLTLWLTIVAAVLAFAGCSRGGNVEARMSKALQYQAQGEYRSAMIELKNVLQKQPDNAKARLALGEVSLALGDPADAEDQLSRAAKLGIPSAKTRLPLANALLAQNKFQDVLDRIKTDDVDDPTLKAKLLATRGEAYLGLNKPDEAEKAFADALAAKPGLPAALVGQARLALVRGDRKTAAARVQAALKADPDSGDAWLIKGSLDTDQQKYDAAVADFNKVLDSKGAGVSPQDRFLARGHLVEVLLRQNKQDKALKYVNTMLKQSPKHPYPNYLRALIAYQQKDYDLAAEKLQVVLSAAPDNLTAQRLLGMVKANQGDYGQAEMYLGNVVDQHPDDLQARKMLASVLMRDGQPDRAEATLHPGLKKDGHDAQLLAMLGGAALEKGDTKSGLSYLQQSVKADPANPDLKMTLARALLQQGENDQAMHVLKQLNQPDRGKDFEREKLLILALLRKGESDKAIAEAEAVVKKRPDDPAAHNLAGGVYMEIGRNDDARAQFEKAQKLAPDNQAAGLNLGLLALREKKPQEAVKQLKSVLDKHADSVPAMFALARAYNALGKTDETLKWLEKVRAADAKAITARILLARYYLSHNQAQRARTIAEEAVAAAPDKPGLLELLGAAQFHSGQKQAAVTTFRKAVAAAPDKPLVRFNLARAEIGTGQYDAAIASLQKVRKQKPKYLPAVFLLAETQLRAGDTDTAFATARSLGGKGGNDGAADLLEGDLYMIQNDYKSAAKAYADAQTKGNVRSAVGRALTARERAGIKAPEQPLLDWLSKHPDDHEVRALLAQWYTQQDKYAEAGEQYEKLIKTGGDKNPVLLNNLAWVYFKRNDARALDTARKAHQLAPDSAAITDTLGWIEVQNGDTAKGLDLLQQAVKQAPDAADVRYHLAVALVKSGKQDEARKQLAQILQGDGKFSSRPDAEKLAQKLAKK